MIARFKSIGKVPHLVSEREFVEAPVPEYVYVAVETARAPKAEVFVKEGDHVSFCQKIGVRHGPNFDLPIFSTVSGEVVGVEKHLLSSGKPSNFIKIKNDFKDELDASAQPRTAEEIAALTTEDLLKIVDDFGLVGLGGSGFPTVIKLATEMKIDHVLLNGIECEPYMNSDQKLMENHAEDVINGAVILMKMFHCADARICVKGIHGELIEHLNKVIAEKFPGQGISVAPMKNFYPQGWEVSEIKTALGITMEPGKLPPHYGVMNVNVATAASLYYAVAFRRPLVDRYISINGDGIAVPKDFKIRLGTHFTELLEEVGGYTEESGLRMSIGGPMMGVSIPSDDFVFTETANSVLVTKEHAKSETPCIRCGSCVLSCPAHLEPVLIMEAVKSNDRDRIKMLKPLNCMECGLCTYSCTSGIRVTDFVRRAKILAKL